MRLYRPGPLGGLDSQLLYHALARVGREGLVLCRPDGPYVSIGYHQDLAQEIDLAHCRRRGLPVFRREVAGGAVYLDRGQLFYQLVVRRGNPRWPARRERLFARLLGPVVATLRELGLPARLVPPCDIHVGGRKISGNGAGEIGDCAVLVGNLLVEFDCAAMSRVLRLPGEGARRVVRREMERALTTLRRELPRAPSLEALEERLAGAFARAVPGLEAGEVPPEVWAKAREIEPEYRAPQWLYEPGRTLPYRELKIAEGTCVYAFGEEGAGAAPLLLVVRKGRIRWVGTAGGEAGVRWRSFLGRRLLVERLRRVPWDELGTGAQPGWEDPGRLLSAVTR
ncbi:MAG: hypothetical protein Kow0092_38080 [Deferrisomatales bacterium]